MRNKSGELFAPKRLEPKPKWARPRLAVRRWILWDGKGEVLGDLGGFVDGLNVIHAADIPPEGTRKGAAGHGVGKSLFCRLLRFGLGDDLDDAVRHGLVHAFGEARVGLVVAIDDAEVAVVRSVESPGQSLVFAAAELAQGPQKVLKHKGPATLLRDLLAPLLGDDDAIDWRTLLMTGTRDQEARRDVETWREPAVGRREARAAELLRQLGLFSPAIGAGDERAEEERREFAERERDAADDAKQSWSYAQKQSIALRKLMDLRRTKDDDDPLLGATRILATAKERLASASAVPTTSTSASMECERLRARQRDLQRAIDCADIEVRAQENILGTLTKSRQDFDGLVAELVRTSVGPFTVCSCCGQAIVDDKTANHAKAECDLKLASARANLVDVSGKEKAACAAMEKWKDKRAADVLELSTLDRKLAAPAAQVADEEAQRQQDIGAARLVEEEAVELVKLVQPSPRSPNRRAPRARAKPDVEGDIAGRRLVFQARYASVIAEILGDDANAEISFAGNSVAASLDLRGGSTNGATGYRVLAVLAFDITTMLLRAEGHLPGPAFLLHDSPRDGDMSSLLYDDYLRIFATLQKPTPFFQAFVTTTTPLPDDVKPRFIHTLRASPTQRLLARPF